MDGYYEGTFNGHQVRFKSSYAGRDISEAERDQLLAGQTVDMMGFKSKNDPDKTYGMRVRLNDHLEYNGHTYCGIERVDWLHDDSRPPKSMWGHTFSDSEIEALMDGKTILVKGLKWKNGKVGDANLSWEDTGNGKRIVPHFDR